MFTIPPSNLPANSTADFQFDLNGTEQPRPAAVAPVPSLGPTWAGALWTAWVEQGSASLPSPPAHRCILRIRVANPTTAALNLGAQDFVFTAH